MKIKSIIVFLLISTFNAYSQNTFDKSLNEISIDIAGKLSQKGKKKIVVLYVTDINKSQTVAGKYMADVISVNIVNDQGNFEVFDRENLSGIVEAKKMMAEGYIDATKVKELGKLLAVDAIVIGNYTVLTTTLKLTLKALDVNSGFVIAATMIDLPITEDAGALLGISVGTVDNNLNKGFNNIPLSSNENYNNPNTVNKECEQNNTGDVCFKNATKTKVNVLLYGSAPYGGNKVLTLELEEMQCFYDLVVRAYTYQIRVDGQERSGEIKIERCKSKTFIIK